MALAFRDQRAEQLRVAEQVQVAYVVLRNMGVSSAPHLAGRGEHPSVMPSLGLAEGTAGLLTVDLILQA